MAKAYDYPTAGMIAAQAQSNRAAGTRLRGVETAVDTSNLGAPTTVLGRMSFRQWLGIKIMGADAGSVWFAPQQPLQPVAQPQEMGVVGRPWDYPVGWNTRVTPRTGLPVGFAALKSLAEGYDLLRIIIERVKDDVLTADWTIGPKDKKGVRDDRSDTIEDFLAYPDRDLCWDDWARKLLEQLLVYDAPAIYLRPTRGGDPYALEIIDGSLVSPKVMADGRLPPAEWGPAYQAVYHGLGAVDYVKPVPRGTAVPRDPNGQPFPEMLYRPRNVRVDSVYGYSPVEQIIVTIGIGLRREAFLQSYYTHGSTPDLLIQVPDTWNPEQIKQMQDTLDSILAGNLENRRMMRLIPGGAKVVDTREKALTDETDQWLMRICCFAFGISPMPFVKIMNRATGQQHAQQQEEEGALPVRRWLAQTMNWIIAFKFGMPDLVFRWTEEIATDPLQEAQRLGILVDKKLLHPDEGREDLGRDPMPAAMREQMDQPTFAASVNATVLPPDQQADADKRKQAEIDAQPPAPGVAGKVGKGHRGGSSRSIRSVVRY